jgi:HAD superfamily hydrolase (TIGR01509 family)
MTPAGSREAPPHALLVDLYETIAWLDWTSVGGQLCAALDVSMDQLFQAFLLTRPGRSVGRYGSCAGDLGALALACGRQLSPPALHALAADTVALSCQHVHLYADVLPAIRELRSLGTRVAVVSNCDHITRSVVDALGLEREFDAVILSCEVRVHKPNAGIFHAALERIAAAPRHATFIDDQAAYLDGAAALGLRTFQIQRTRVPNDDAPSRHPVVTDFSDLPALLR